MTKDTVHIHKLNNGMTLVVEPMGDVSSAAFVFRLPVGTAHDPAGRTGTATVLAELLFRGTERMDNRTLNNKLDSLGLHRSETSNSIASTFSGSLVSDKLFEALPLYADVLRTPTLAADQFASCRELSIQSLASLDDDPRQKITLLLRENYLPEPLNRFVPGKREELQALTEKEVKEHWQRSFSPSQTIFSAAGKVDFNQLKDAAEQYFGPWKGSAAASLPAGQPRKQVFHQANAGAQVHIGVMYPSVNYTDSTYYAALAAVGVLSGGMGSRLFTEVREKRGLCYSVGAAHRVIGPHGAVQCYLGSTPEQAQEGLDVLLAELVKLKDGISTDELERAKVGLRASLIMQGESSGARAAGCAGDYFHLGRVRSLDEIEAAIKALTVKDVMAHVQQHEPKDFTVVTIGPKELMVNNG